MNGAGAVTTRWEQSDKTKTCHVGESGLLDGIIEISHVTLYSISLSCVLSYLDGQTGYAAVLRL